MSRSNGSPRRLAAALAVAALLVAGCGGGDDGGSGNGPGEINKPTPVKTGGDVKCPFTVDQVGEAVGQDVKEIPPVDATFPGGATCQFGAASGSSATSVSFGVVGSDDLTETKKTYTGGGGEGKLVEKPEWGEGAFVWSNEVVGTVTALGFFPTDDSGAVGVNVVVPADGQADPAKALDSLVELVGPAG